MCFKIILQFKDVSIFSSKDRNVIVDTAQLKISLEGFLQLQSDLRFFLNITILLRASSSLLTNVCFFAWFIQE